MDVCACLNKLLQPFSKQIIKKWGVAQDYCRVLHVYNPISSHFSIFWETHIQGCGPLTDTNREDKTTASMGRGKLMMQSCVINFETWSKLQILLAWFTENMSSIFSHKIIQKRSSNSNIIKSCCAKWFTICRQPDSMWSTEENKWLQQTERT